MTAPAQPLVMKASVPVALRGLGLSLTLVGAFVALGVLAAAVLDGVAQTIALAAVALLALPAIGGVVTALVRMAGMGARFEVDDLGFSNRTGVLGVGVRRADWTEVAGLRSMRDVLVVDLDGGRRSLVDARVLGTTPQHLAEVVRPHVGRPYPG
jgi:hypothetical protein